MNFVIGIDPGMSGGIAWIASTVVSAQKMPETEADIYDLVKNTANLICRNSDGRSAAHCYIESVHSMPKQGVSSSFKFGFNFGLLIGILSALEIPFTRVTPQKWQKEMECMSKGDKNVTKRRAQQLYPSLKITHATADALLIATYGMKCQNSTTGNG